MADLDGNGTVDIVSGSWPGEIYVFNRKRNGIYLEPVKLMQGGKPLNVGKASAVAVTDWNDDRALDLVIGNIDGHVLLVTNKARSQQWGEPKRLAADDKPILADGGDAGPCVADWDGDGLADLLVGSGSGAVQWFRNTGTKTAPKLTKPVVLVSATGREDTLNTQKKSTAPAIRAKPAVADWNGDGRPDLLVGDLFYNDGCTNARDYHGYVWVFLRKPTVSTATR